MTSGSRAQLSAGRRFILRTPLLPIDTLLSFDLDPGTFRLQLRGLLADPAVREAIFVASPSLEARIEEWERDPLGERGRGVELAVVRYVLRMASRATPFGLFAGCSVGAVHERTRLSLDARSENKRKTRLDTGYLFALTAKLEEDRALRHELVLFANSTLLDAHGTFRFIAAKAARDSSKVHELVIADADAPLRMTLARAERGATLSELARQLCEADPEVADEEAQEYLHELIDQQLLVSELSPAVTSTDARAELVPRLPERIEIAKLAATTLERVGAGLSEIDASGLGAPPTRYRAIAALLEPLPHQADLAKIFQVDMVKGSPEASLARAVADDLLACVERLSTTVFAKSASLDSFVDAFRARYEGQEVPLLEALDDEIGVGFATAEHSGDPAPLLEGLGVPEGDRPAERVEMRRAELVMLRHLERAWTTGSDEIRLDAKDLDELRSDSAKALPDAFVIQAEIGAGEPPQLLLRGSYGPSGMQMLGRFCHADPEIERLVREHLEAEERLRPDALFAEIVHLPEGRMGNILSRPVLRPNEIPFLGRSAAPPDRQIALSDLLVSVRQGRVVLRSRQHRREVIPSLTSAHNLRHSKNVALYRFLGQLQFQDSTILQGPWGPPFEELRFLPRVSVGRVALSRARWRLDQEAIERLLVAKDDLAKAAAELRAEYRLPRFTKLADGDNELLVDWENPNLLSAVVDTLRGRSSAVLYELFTPPTEFPCTGPEGRFAHELLVPFVRRAPAPIEVSPPRDRAAARSRPRTFLPGGSVLYAKIYAGSASVDRILTRWIAPIVRRGGEEGLFHRWFFIRYGDPHWHLRVRFFGEEARLRERVLPLLEVASREAAGERLAWKLQLDTYEREVERYGGPVGVELSEELFHADSEAVLALLPLLEGDEGADARWRVALFGIDLLFDALGLDFSQKLAVATELATGYAREFDAEKSSLKHRIGARFREHRAEIASFFQNKEEPEALAPAMDVLRRRSLVMRPTVDRLVTAIERGEVDVSLPTLASSYAHMFVNRLARSRARAQELVLYDFARRIYESQAAQARKAPRARS